jgi:hypothetical protein
MPRSVLCVIFYIRQLVLRKKELWNTQGDIFPLVSCTFDDGNKMQMIKKNIFCLFQYGARHCLKMSANESEPISLIKETKKDVFHVKYDFCNNIMRPSRLKMNITQLLKVGKLTWAVAESRRTAMKRSPRIAEKAATPLGFMAEDNPRVLTVGRNGFLSIQIVTHHSSRTQNNRENTFVPPTN